MLKVALVTTTALLLASNAFAMSEQAKGALDAANTVYYFTVVNKYCKFMPKAEFAENFGYITDFAAEYMVQYPDYDIQYRGLADKANLNLKDANKQKIKKFCTSQKQEFENFYNTYGQWED